MSFRAHPDPTVRCRRRGGEAPYPRLATPRASEVDGRPLPLPQTQPLEKKQNREINQIKPS